MKFAKCWGQGSRASFTCTAREPTGVSSTRRRRRWRRMRPTDIVGFDAYGLPVANRLVGYTLEPVSAAVNPLFMGSPDLSNAPQVLGKVLGPQGAALGQKMVQNQQAAANMLGGAFGPGQGYMMPLTVPIPVGQLMMQAQQKGGDFEGATPGGCGGARPLQR